MIDKHLIEHKLKRIENFIREVKSVEIITLDAFKKDVIKKRFIERNLQLSIEEMIDICKHIVSSLDLPSTETYNECFMQLADEGIINKKSLATYKKIIGFRNKLIHGYEKMDELIIYGVYRKGFRDFQLYIKEIRNYLHRD
jgi:uncharacterized protein YutE (UPF0331/DUF86 family)